MRIIEKQILQKIETQKAILIFGARRVGKTMLLNGEDIDAQALLEVNSIERYQELLGTLQLLAIDEAQATPNIGKIIKLLVDNVSRLSVIATGSSAFDLPDKTGGPLVGGFKLSRNNHAENLFNVSSI